MTATDAKPSKYHAFGDALANEMACSDLTNSSEDDTPTRHAIAVLAMPEMQAIRKYLALHAWQLGSCWHRVGRPDDPESFVNLPASVVAWVEPEPCTNQDAS